MSDVKSLGEVLRDVLSTISFNNDERYVLNGVQLKLLLTMFEHAVKLHDKFDKENLQIELEMEFAKEVFEKIADRQRIGMSTNSMEDDIQDIRNLFASWLSKTE